MVFQTVGSHLWEMLALYDEHIFGQNTNSCFCDMFSKVRVYEQSSDLLFLNALTISRILEQKILRCVESRKLFQAFRLSCKVAPR